MMLLTGLDHHINYTTNLFIFLLIEIKKIVTFILSLLVLKYVAMNMSRLRGSLFVCFIFKEIYPGGRAES